MTLLSLVSLSRWCVSMGTMGDSDMLASGRNVRILKAWITPEP